MGYSYQMTRLSNHNKVENSAVNCSGKIPFSDHTHNRRNYLTLQGNLKGNSHSFDILCPSFDPIFRLTYIRYHKLRSHIQELLRKGLHTRVSAWNSIAMSKEHHFPPGVKVQFFYTISLKIYLNTISQFRKTTLFKSFILL